LFTRENPRTLPPKNPKNPKKSKKSKNKTKKNPQKSTKIITKIQKDPKICKNPQKICKNPKTRKNPKNAKKKLLTLDFFQDSNLQKSEDFFRQKSKENPYLGVPRFNCSPGRMGERPTGGVSRIQRMQLQGEREDIVYDHDKTRADTVEQERLQLCRRAPVALSIGLG
jgi:hypothetical protein